MIQKSLFHVFSTNIIGECATLTQMYEMDGDIYFLTGGDVVQLYSAHF